MLEITKQFHPIILECLEKQYEPTFDDLKQEYNPFMLNSFQYYQPVLKLLFDIKDQNYNINRLFAESTSWDKRA